jgi:hypothetical protein
MKTARLVLVLLALSTGAFAQDMYLEYKLTGPVTGTSRMYTSAAGMRVEADMTLPQVGPVKNVTLVRADRPNVLITYTDKAKTYQEMDTKAAGVETVKYDVKIVGKERVGAYNTTHTILSVNGKPTMDVWTTRDLPGYGNLMKLTKTLGSMGSENLYRQLEASGAGGMMVKMKPATGNGMAMELTKAERRNNPASLFAVPVGYTKSTFDPAKLQNMSPADRQKAVQEMMKQYGGKPQKP